MVGNTELGSHVASLNFSTDELPVIHAELDRSYIGGKLPVREFALTLPGDFISTCMHD
jgi:hypothetical protein